MSILPVTITRDKFREICKDRYEKLELVNTNTP